MRKDKERGAIVVEATLVLTAFIFAIFTILTLVNVAYIQSKISVALNSAAKDISQYSYLYYKLGINDIDKTISEGTEKYNETAKNTIDGVATMVGALSDGKEAIENFDVAALNSAVNEGTTTVDSLVTQYSDLIADDPKAFIIGMGKMALSDLNETGKALLGQVLAKAFMEKNLKAYRGDDPDDFLRRYRVVDGMSGLDFNYTTLMAFGTSNQIQLCVTYDVSIIKLLNIDFKFTFRQVSKTTAWGNGVSLINPSQNAPKASVWDLPPLERGKILVAEEKKSYKYTSSGNGFDAYESGVGFIKKNQFVSIISLDTHSDTYSTASKISYQLNNQYNKLVNGVSKLGPSFEVTNKSGATVTVNSKESTRTYKIVLIVPEDADMSVVNAAVSKFKESKNKVSVEICRDYGSPTPKDTGGDNSK